MSHEKTCASQSLQASDGTTYTVYSWVKKFGTDPEVIAAQVFKSDEHQMREMQKRIREQQEENEILKKSDVLLRERTSVKYSFIHEHRFEYRLEKLCSVLNVSRSGYYKWRCRPETAMTMPASSRFIAYSKRN
ncbi:hypothetical protein D3C81_770400 [compost metagenome]